MQNSGLSNLNQNQDKPMIDTIIFDLGGVLIDWNPKYLYRKIFDTEEEVEDFLDNICTFSWNEEQDGGRSIAEANALLIDQYPEHEDEIRAFYGRWTEMLGGAIEPMVDIFKACKAKSEYNVYALTNWSAETWPIAWSTFPFLHQFDGIVVSGQERLKKPDKAIYERIISRYGIEPQKAIFIDDNLRNIKAAKKHGLHTIHHLDPDSTADKLRALKII